SDVRQLQSTGEISIPSRPPLRPTAISGVSRTASLSRAMLIAEIIADCEYDNTFVFADDDDC
ncbi:MAG: hypothetical protein ACREDU_00490, partial [Methylocella sp.]